MKGAAVPSVLAIGLDPACVDPSAYGGHTPEEVRAYIEAEFDRARGMGYEVDGLLIDPAEGAEAAVEQALRARAYDCVLIGGGLRKPPELLQLFERILNLAHRLAPRSRIAFNTTPADTAEAVRRWV